MLAWGKLAVDPAGKPDASGQEEYRANEK